MHNIVANTRNKLLKMVIKAKIIFYNLGGAVFVLTFYGVKVIVK